MPSIILIIKIVDFWRFGLFIIDFDNRWLLSFSNGFICFLGGDELKTYSESLFFIVFVMESVTF